MNVIPFPVRQAPSPLAFAIGARIDLRVGALASGVVRACDPGPETFGFSNLARLLRGARMAWLERGLHAALTLVIPPERHGDLEAELLSDAAIEAGGTRHNLNFQMSERELVAAGPGLAEGMRARGWNIVLRGDPECPLPFGKHARNLYAEVVVDVPETPDPFLALEDGDRTPLGRRLLAAKAAGLVLTADTVSSASQARTLAIAGFDRCGGPHAEARFR